eukprot:74079_1
MSKLMHKHCLNELPFELQSTAKNTLEAHISYLFEALLEHEKIDSSLSSGDVMVTELGTLIDGKSPGPIKSIQYAPCTLVKELLKEAEIKHLLKKFKKGFADFFSKTNDDVWMENKEKFVNQDVNQAAFELISLAKSQGDKSHIAKQLIAKLLNSFCPNIKSFFKKQDTDKDLMFEVVNSIEDLLTQLKHQGTIHIGKHEIPAIDTGGFLVAVDKFSLNEEESFEDKWVSCVFVDKLVYYHNVNIEKQATVLIDQVRDNNYYAFETQVDIMMLEHCGETVSTLKAKKGTNDPSDLYLSVFRGEFASFVHEIAHDDIMVDDPEDIVVVNNGGIMHRFGGHTGGHTVCPLVQEIAKHAKKWDDEEKHVPKFDEHMFDPEYHADLDDMDWEKEFHHMKHDPVSMEQDAQNIVRHALANEQFELKHLVTNMMYLYHSDHIMQFTADQMEAIVNEGIMYVSSLTDVKGKSAWPEGHRVVIDIDNARLMLLDENSQAWKTGNKVVSPLFTRVFELALTNTEGKKDVGNDGKDSNEEVRSYVSVLLGDIKSSKDIIGLRRDIENDLKHWCSDMWNQLTARARRIMLSKLLTAVKDSTYSIVDPVVNQNGMIKTGNGVDETREKIFRCPFVTELLTQRV